MQQLHMTKETSAGCMISTLPKYVPEKPKNAWIFISKVAHKTCICCIWMRRVWWCDEHNIFVYKEYLYISYIYIILCSKEYFYSFLFNPNSFHPVKAATYPALFRAFLNGRKESLFLGRCKKGVWPQPQPAPVDGSEIRRSPVDMVVFSHYLRGVLPISGG